mmetsp:Transcript_45609/g.73340  ORF Transcript_45609/g.73340 Transcript_45609/m.73340 type:complete len:532 (+) Transcript_45609:167-1762(+)
MISCRYMIVSMMGLLCSCASATRAVTASAATPRPFMASSKLRHRFVYTYPKPPQSFQQRVVIHDSGITTAGGQYAMTPGFYRRSSNSKLVTSSTATTLNPATPDAGRENNGAIARIRGFFKDLIIHDGDDHDDHDHELMGSSTESDAAKVKSARRVVWLGIYGDILLTAVKAGVGTVARSPALLADALHSLADIVGHFVTLICVQLARRPSNEVFPYGFGKFETVGSLFVALLMVAAGVELIHQSVAIITSPGTLDPVSAPLLVAAGATAATAVLIKEVLYQLTLREGRRQGSDMLETTAWHHRSDAMSSATALIGIIGTIMGVRWADPLAGSLVAALVLSIGVQIAWKSVKELMDMSVPAETLERLEALVQEASDRGFESLDADSNGRISRSEWIEKYGSEDGFSSYDTDGNGYIDIREWNSNRLKVVSVRARKMGPHLMLDVDMDVPAGARFAEIQKAQDKMLKHIHSSNPRVREIRFQLTTSRAADDGGGTRKDMIGGGGGGGEYDGFVPRVNSESKSFPGLQSSLNR